MLTSDETTREGIAPASPPTQLFLVSEGVVISTALSLTVELGLICRKGPSVVIRSNAQPGCDHEVIGVTPKEFVGGEVA